MEVGEAGRRAESEGDVTTEGWSERRSTADCENGGGGHELRDAGGL